MKKEIPSIYRVKGFSKAFRCNICGKWQTSPPILLPKNRIKPVVNKPGFYEVSHLSACIDCAVKNLPIISEKIKAGEFLPMFTWNENMELKESVMVTNKGTKLASKIFKNEKGG